MVNNVTICGRLTKDPEVKKTKLNKDVCNIVLAVQNTRKTDMMDWVKIIAWNKIANNIKKYCKKGDLLLVQGRIRAHTYQDNDGRYRYLMAVEANEIQFLTIDNSRPVKQQLAMDDIYEQFDIDDEDAQF